MQMQREKKSLHLDPVGLRNKLNVRVRKMRKEEIPHFGPSPRSRGEGQCLRIGRLQSWSDPINYSAAAFFVYHRLPAAQSFVKTTLAADEVPPSRRFFHPNGGLTTIRLLVAFEREAV